MSPPRPTVGLLVPYWSFWEASAGGSRFRREREALVADLARALESLGFEVVAAPLLDGEADPGELADGLSAADVVVVAQSMAVPPSHAMSVLDRIPSVPIVVWALQLSATIDDSFDEASITSLGATVGSPMITNALSRRGRPFALEFTTSTDAEPLEPALRAAATAAAVRRARLGRIGRPLDGYECVDVDHDLLRVATGIEVVEIAAAELADRYHRSAGPTGRIAEEVRERFLISPDVEAEDLDRSIRLAAALADLDEAYDITMGAINCHVDEIRYADEPGLTPCFGVGRETSRGIPWTCVGDAVTAVAMLVGKRLGGASLYHEIEAIDPDTDEVVLANSGEHDLGWCRDACEARIASNRWFSADGRMAPIAWFELPPGPATLIGFTPHAEEPSGFRFVVAEGSITPRSFPRSPTVGGAFRFAGNVSGSDGWLAWARTGVNHHSAASPGHLSVQVAAVASHLDVGCVIVTG